MQTEHYSHENAALSVEQIHHPHPALTDIRSIQKQSDFLKKKQVVLGREEIKAEIVTFLFENGTISETETEKTQI